MSNARGRSTPAVSVILPVYNAARFLQEALRSLQDQTFEDFEVLAVDDGSTDLSRDILLQFAGEDERFQVLVQENRGAAAARNLAIHAARAPLLALADADDVSLPARFHLQTARFAADPDLAVLGTGAGVIDEDGALCALSLLPPAHEAIEDALLRGHSLYNPSVMLRTAAVRAVGAYRSHLRYGEDYDLFLRMLPARFANLDRALVLYRLHSTQTTQRSMVNTAFAARVILESRRSESSSRPDPIDSWSGTPEMPIVCAVSRSEGAELQLCADLLSVIRRGSGADDPVDLSDKLAHRAMQLAAEGFDAGDLQHPDRVVSVGLQLWKGGSRWAATLYLLRLVQNAPAVTLRSFAGNLRRPLLRGPSTERHEKGIG